MANKYFDPLELALKLRKAKETGDTSEVWNYTKTFLDTTPESKEGKTQLPSMDPSQLNGYVHDMINQSFKQSLGMFHHMFDGSSSDDDKKQPIKQKSEKQQAEKQQSVKQQYEKNMSYSGSKEINERPSNSNFNYDVFETHDYVIVRIKIPNNINQRGIKVRATPSRLFVKLNNYSQEEMILLPTDVDKSDVKATIAKNILEIIIPKEKDTNQQEISIQQL